ncbi:FAD-dependent monooxygenase [Streptomyces sp. CA-249302]|uniref:FAD-dependent monooxygenase n=1 Tax=Streptomyces sp. CA-249302 TaxID=3240058 RepID=UPI003D943306
MEQVIVVGGGPVGIWLAAELCRYGIEVTVLESRPEPDPHSRALSLHPRTLEMLACRGAAEPFLADGLAIPSGHFAALPSRLDFGGLDTPFPFSLALPQVRTEELLALHARSTGVRLLRGHRVVGLTQDERAVTVRVEGPRGSYEKQASYVVGCDGTRSTVREAAGIDFPGTPATAWAWMADVVLDEPPHPPSVFNERGTVMAFPLPGGIHRVVGNDAASVRTRPGPLTFDELRSKVYEITGTDFGMRDARWLSRFGNTARQAAAYRAGRVLLAGDAAHMHFPSGGPGLNVGLQDAFNLGWKLARTLTGTAPRGLLDTYHTERHPVGAELLRSTRAQTALMTNYTAESLALRDLIGELIPAVGDFSAELARRAAGLSVAYPPAPDTHAHPLTGHRAPDLALGTVSLFSLLRDGDHVLLDLTGRAADALAPTAHDARPGLRVHSARAAGDRAEWTGVTAALVRPDGHLAWLTEETDGPKMIAEARRAAAGTATGRPTA